MSSGSRSISWAFDLVPKARPERVDYCSHLASPSYPSMLEPCAPRGLSAITRRRTLVKTLLTAHSHHARGHTVIVMPKFSIRLDHLRDWTAPLLEAATRTRGYPTWLMVGIKAVVTIGLLTAAAAWTVERSAKAHLAQLAGDAAKATPSRASRQR